MNSLNRRKRCVGENAKFHKNRNLQRLPECEFQDVLEHFGRQCWPNTWKHWPQPHAGNDQYQINGMIGNNAENVFITGCVRSD